MSGTTSSRPSPPMPHRTQEFVLLFVESEPRLYSFIRSLVPLRADAENVLQETAAVLWQKFDQFQPGSDFFRWAVTVARFQVLYFRQQQGRNVLHFSQAFLEALEDTSLHAAEGAEELKQALDECLEQLHEADQDLFRRRYVPGAKVPEIASALGRPASTVYHTLDRIRRALVDCVTAKRLAKEAG